MKTKKQIIKLITTTMAGLPEVTYVYEGETTMMDKTLMALHYKVITADFEGHFQVRGYTAKPLFIYPLCYSKRSSLAQNPEMMAKIQQDLQHVNRLVTLQL
ncbi:MAG: hypothetical protein ACXVJD_17770 [Mucilaginibacter sp.]